MSFGVVENVRKEFHVPGKWGRKASTVVALENASFKFERGELVSLLGPSGCGKTTLLRMVAGLVEKTSGSVKIGGVEVNRPLGNYGFVFQTASLMPWRNVLDNVLFPLEILRRRDGTAEKRALELLSLVGLKGFESSRPHQLSGGMQQRVSLCRALIHQPELLLMDEPFGALDELTRLEMNDLLLSIRQETGAAVLFVTHSISEAIYVADQVLVFSCRPATICRRIQVDLPYPRQQKHRFTAEFSALEQEASIALGVLEGQAQEGQEGIAA